MAVRMEELVTMLGPDGPAAFDAAVGRAVALCAGGSLGEARLVLGQVPGSCGGLPGVALAHARRLSGPDHALLIQTLHNLALSLDQVGRADDARTLWTEARSIAETHQGGTA